MAFDFPSSPTTGQTYQVTGGPTYVYNGTAWAVLTPGSRFNRTTFTATANQTTFTVSYVIGAVDVFVNGVKYVSGLDFTATNGTSVVLTTGANAGDTVEVVSYSQVNYTNTVQKTGDTMTGNLIVNASVGIGAASPQAPLDVRDTACISGSQPTLFVGTNTTSTGNCAIQIGDSRTGNGYAYIDFVGDTVYTDYGLRIIRENAGQNANSSLEHRGGGNLRLNCVEGAPIVFGTSNTERARIGSNGVLYVGYTSGGNGNAGIIAARGHNTKPGLDGALGGNTFNIDWTGTAQLWIDTTNIGTFSFTSDYRVKKNVETQTASGIDRIMQLRPVKYELKDYGDLFKADGVEREGFIAHEVQEVIPSGAEGEKDEEGRIQNLRVDAILAVAVKAIQEQQSIIEDLKARIVALENA